MLPNPFNIQLEGPENFGDNNVDLRGAVYDAWHRSCAKELNKVADG
jgi:hypothetical protein